MVFDILAPCIELHKNDWVTPFLRILQSRLKIDGVDDVCEDGGDATSTGEMIPRSVTLALSGPAATTAQ